MPYVFIDCVCLFTVKGSSLYMCVILGYMNVLREKLKEGKILLN